MTVSDEYLEWVIDQLAELGPVTSRAMFGAAGLWSEGVFFGVVDDDVAYFRAGDGDRADALARGGEPFRPFPGKASMSYFAVPTSVLEDPTELAAWARRAIAAATMKARSKARPQPKGKPKPKRAPNPASRPKSPTRTPRRPA